MKVLLLIIALLYDQWAMGTDNNFCKHNPSPAVELKSFTATNQCGLYGFVIDVKKDGNAICMQGRFHITGSNPGKFNILYKADASGKIMGFIPYVKNIPLCNNQNNQFQCNMEVDCPKVKQLLGDKHASATKCFLQLGDVNFVISTTMPGKINLPDSVISGLKGPQINVQVDVTDVHSPTNYVKIACVSEDIAMQLKG